MKIGLWTLFYSMTELNFFPTLFFFGFLAFPTPRAHKQCIIMVCLPKPLIVVATIVDQNRLSEVKLSHREYFLQIFFLGLRPIYSMAEPQVPLRACFTLYPGAENGHFGALIYSIAEVVPR